MKNGKSEKMKKVQKWNNEKWKMENGYDCLF
jgi:hypothetical protein